MDTGSPLILIAVASILLSVFAIGLGTTPGVARRALATPAPILAALAAMFLVMPLAAILIARVVPLEPAVRIALVAICLSPLPPLFPRKEDKLEAGEGPMIATQLAAALAALVVAPAIILIGPWLSGSAVAFEPGRLVVILLATIILPLLLGILINRLLPAFAASVRKPLGTAAMIVLLGCVALILVATWGSLRAAMTPPALLAMVLLVAVGLAAGHVVGRHGPTQGRALAVAIISRHPGVAITLAAMAAATDRGAIIGAVLLYLLLSAIAGLVWMRATEARLAH